MTNTRQPIIAANWKMNGSTLVVDSVTKLLNNGSWSSKTQVIVAPPALYLASVRDKVRKEVLVAAQNIHSEANGAYTGEISHVMLKDHNISWTILGHSERREIFHESDALIAKKTVVALASGLNVIFCIGEKLDERESGKTTEVVYRQLASLIEAGVSDWSKIVIAYEPVWAIGTGKVATPAQAQQVHVDIRKWLREKVSEAAAESTRILYGGSVNGGNCKALAVEKDIDGFLVGGASLKDEFLVICQSMDE